MLSPSFVSDSMWFEAGGRISPRVRTDGERSGDDAGGNAEQARKRRKSTSFWLAIDSVSRHVVLAKFCSQRLQLLAWLGAAKHSHFHSASQPCTLLLLVFVFVLIF
jgi:hypothetical protein